LSADQVAQQYINQRLGMTNQPPPSAETPPLDAARKGGGSPLDSINMPIQTVETLAQLYTQHRGIARTLARLGGFKIPPDIDQALVEIGKGNAAGLKDLQEMATAKTGQLPAPEPQEQEEGIDELEVGKPVVTDKMIAKMVKLHIKGWGVRDIAQYMTDHGNPMTYQTVANWINKYEAQKEEADESRLGSVLKGAALIGGVSFLTFLIVLGMHLAHFI
jgi:hypothetical protein